MKRIAIVAGETSGDILGAGLIKALRTHYPDAIFEGIAGPRMLAEGCKSLFPIEALSVMGLWEVIKHLPTLLRIRYQLIKHFLSNRPDIFIGLDAPDFNLGLEKKLRKVGILTVHYNSPAIWAWRAKRIHKIKQAVDLMLTLLPFEAPLYESAKISAHFVGHPLADSIPLESDVSAARTQLGLSQNAEVVALLPGSRGSEIQRLGELFLRTALLCLKNKPNLQFIAPMANENRLAQFQKLQQAIAPQLPLTLILGHSQTAMAASNVILLASGTATLEAALIKRPMVVAYRFAPLTAWIVKRRVTISRFALPNILSGKELVPEYMQADATPENLASALLDWLSNPQKVQSLIHEYDLIHKSLRCNASVQAADAIYRLDRMRHATDNSTSSKRP